MSTIKSQPQFSYAVLPSYVMDDESLDEGAKVLYARISMYAQEGRCWATNAHFAAKQKVTIRCIQKWLAQLEDAEYIEVEVIRGGFQTSRNIWLIGDFKKMFTKRTAVHAPPVNCSSSVHEPQFIQTTPTPSSVEPPEVDKEKVVVVVKTQADSIAKGLKEKADYWGSQWNIAKHFIETLLERHSFHYVIAQIDYMVEKQIQAVKDEKTSKKRKQERVDHPRAFLAKACQVNFADFREP